jgi:cystathionine beta-lyase
MFKGEKMSEKNLDFDQIIDRRGTGCLKYDFAKKMCKPEGVLPLWVADMDFQISSYVQEALQNQVSHGIYGYSERSDGYFPAVADWMWRHHGWKVYEKWLVMTPGVVYALAMAVQAFTKPGETVLIQQPVYYPFAGVIRDNGRQMVTNTLVYDGQGHYSMDLEDLERKLSREDVTLMIFCSPHNPVGRVWDEQELIAVAQLCKTYGVILVSDEIHQDFAWEKKHHVLVSLKEEYQDFVITATAPSKTFNIAGLQASNIFIPNRQLRRQFVGAIKASGYSQLNAAALVAAEAAYAHGEEWYQAMRSYVKANIEFAERFFKKELPGLSMVWPEGTYLVWFDCRGLGLPEPELERWILEDAGLWLDGGGMFGEGGSGFQRINVACPRKTLELALNRLKKAYEKMV